MPFTAREFRILGVAPAVIGALLALFAPEIFSYIEGEYIPQEQLGAVRLFGAVLCVTGVVLIVFGREISIQLS